MESPRIQRALVSVSDKQGLADFARGLVAAGVEIFSTGGTRKHLEVRRHPGPRRCRLHRLPRDDGRAAQDAASQGPRRHPLPARQPRGHAGPGRARHPDLRVGRRQSLSLRDHDPQAGRDARRGDRADRHRRADDGPRGGQEPCLHDHRHRRRGSTARSSSRSRPTAAPRWNCGGSWPARPSPTRPSTIGPSPTILPA